MSRKHHILSALVASAAQAAFAESQPPSTPSRDDVAKLVLAASQAASAAEVATQVALQASKASSEAARAAELAASAAKAAYSAANAAKITVLSSEGAQLDDAQRQALTFPYPQVGPTSNTQVVPKPILESSNLKSVGSRSGAQVTANQSGGNASIKLTQSSEQAQHGLLYSVLLSSPLSKTSDITEPATLDGLSNAASVGLNLAKFAPFDSNHLDVTPFYLLGGAAKLGYQQFTYYDSTSLAKNMTSRSPSSLSGYVGLASPGEARLLGILKYEYQNAYQDATSKVLCPDSETSPTACVSGPIGLPVRKTKRISSLEMHYVANSYELHSIFSYDSQSRVRGVDVPIYFLGGSDPAGKITPFSAGFDIGWRSDTNKTSFGIFVGAPVSFWLPGTN